MTKAQRMRSALQRAGWDRFTAAEHLGVSARNVHRWLIQALADDGKYTPEQARQPMEPVVRLAELLAESA